MSDSASGAVTIGIEGQQKDGPNRAVLKVEQSSLPPISRSLGGFSRQYTFIGNSTQQDSDHQPFSRGSLQRRPGGLARGPAGLSSGVRMLSPKPFTSSVPGNSRPAPNTTSQSAEWAHRFVPRQNTRLRVVGLDSESMIPRGKSSKGMSRGIGGFFPPVKLRMGSETPSASSVSKLHAKAKSPPVMLELAPERPTAAASLSPDHWSSRTAPAGRLAPSSGTSIRDGPKTQRSKSQASKPPAYPHFVKSSRGAQNIDDLCDLPHPHMVVSRDTPWVYRYKVKKSMNELSKIMASKPPPSMEYTVMQ